MHSCCVTKQKHLCQTKCIENQVFSLICMAAPCDPNPCQNGGTCTDGDCDCTGTGFQGSTCEINSTWIRSTSYFPRCCAFEKFEWQGLCSSRLINLTLKMLTFCQCADPCDPNPCANGGLCFEGTCDCSGTGFQGATCDTDGKIFPPKRVRKYVQHGKPFLWRSFKFSLARLQILVTPILVKTEEFAQKALVTVLTRALKERRVISSVRFFLVANRKK